MNNKHWWNAAGQENQRDEHPMITMTRKDIYCNSYERERRKCPRYMSESAVTVGAQTEKLSKSKELHHRG